MINHQECYRKFFILFLLLIKGMLSSMDDTFYRGDDTWIVNIDAVILRTLKGSSSKNFLDFKIDGCRKFYF